jgi:hypothetical protein
MPYVASKQRSSRKARKTIDIRQNKFSKGYISTIDDSRRPTDSLSDMLNMELVQDNVVRPRPPLAEYGTQPSLTVIGRSQFRQSNERYLLWAMNDSGTGKLYKQKDGGAYTVYADLDNTYDSSAWLSCVQNRNKVYPFNGVNSLSYINLTDDSIVKYTALTTPSISSVTKTGMTGTTYTHYYRVSASNEAGESIASASSNVTSGKLREAWIANTDLIDVTWSVVSGAVSYTVYYSSDNITFYELFSVAGSVTFRDLGTLAYNPYKLAPEGNSSAGAVFTWMYVDTKNSQLFGITADNFLYWSAPGSGNFSPYDGGGYVPIDEDGDTTLNYVTGFRNGKGDPVITISARGAAGKGKLYHVSFDTLTVGDQTIVYPNVYEANGQSGTYAPRATIRSNDDLVYPTGREFRTTGTSQNIVNILTTRRIDQVIEDDTNNITLGSLHKAVGVEDQDRLYFALPVGSTENNEIWYLDRSRKNAWVLRWTVAAKDMWVYEDNSNATHFCVLVDNKVLQFTRAGAQPHQDNDVAWRSRAAFETLVWDDGGYIMGKIRRQYAKLLYPKGAITANTTGLDRNGAISSTGSDSFTVTTTPTGFGNWLYGAAHQYGEDPGVVNTYGKSVAMLEIKPKGLINQLSWEVVADTAGTDYILSGVRTKGFALDDQILRA